MAAAVEAPLPGAAEFEMSPTVDKIFKALVAFRKAMNNLGKDRQGYGYKYTTLSAIIDAAREPLSKNGLAVTQFPIDSPGRLGCVTLVVHESGQYIRSRFAMPIPKLSATNITQDAGAAITYARRYALAAALGIASDDDTDANYERPASIKKKSK